MNEDLDPVRQHSRQRVTRRLDRERDERLAAAVGAAPSDISERIRRLDQEWDIERVLEANAATLTLVAWLAVLRRPSRHRVAVAGIVPASSATGATSPDRVAGAALQAAGDAESPPTRTAGQASAERQVVPGDPSAHRLVQHRRQGGRRQQGVQRQPATVRDRRPSRKSYRLRCRRHDQTRNSAVPGKTLDGVCPLRALPSCTCPQQPHIVG